MKHRFISGKKGLGAGQVFVYIVAALTFALIMIFGYKIINDLIHTGEDVQFLQFKTSLETSIKKNTKLKLKRLIYQLPIFNRPCKVRY